MATEENGKPPLTILPEKEPISIRASLKWVVQKTWLWPVVAIIAAICIGGGISAMYSDAYIAAAAFYFVGIVLVLAKALSWEETKAHKNRKGISLVILIIGTASFVGSLLLVRYTHRELVVSKPSAAVKAVNDEHHDDFAREFTLGYKLFGFANHEFYPFQGTPDIGFTVNWIQKNYSAEFTDETATLHLPDIVIQPNMMLYGTTVSLPNELGSSITFRLDPKSFQRGTAIVSNVFERVKEGAEDLTRESSAVPSPSGSRLTGFPGQSRIFYLTQSTIVWDTTDYYELGEAAPISPGNEIGVIYKVTRGVLHTSRVNIFDDTIFIRGNKFIGGPRGGYKFPKAGTVVGNWFLESIFDASRLPDNAIVTSNRFTSAKGVYRIGPEPQISFVVKIVQPEKGGAVLLFGAKPYTEEEDGNTARH